MNSFEIKILAVSLFVSFVLNIFASVYFNSKSSEIRNLSEKISDYPTATYIVNNVTHTLSVMTETDKAKWIGDSCFKASIILAYGCNAILAVPSLYLFFTCAQNIKNIEVRLKNLSYYKNFWFGVLGLLVGFALMGVACNQYGANNPQNGVAWFIAGEITFIIGCYFIKEYIPTELISPNENNNIRTVEAIHQPIQVNSNNLNNQRYPNAQLVNEEGSSIPPPHYNK
jgi:Na+/H+-translocating membrane pyrophosphatase